MKWMFYTAVILLIFLLIFPYMFSLTEGADGEEGADVQDLKDVQKLLQQKPVTVVEENKNLTSSIHSLNINVEDLTQKVYLANIENKKLNNLVDKVNALYKENLKLEDDLNKCLERIEILKTDFINTSTDAKKTVDYDKMEHDKTLLNQKRIADELLFNKGKEMEAKLRQKDIECNIRINSLK